MNFLKRSLISIKRQPQKNSLLLILVFILGAVLSGAISIGRAIHSIEGSVIQRIPAVATLVLNEQSSDEAEVNGNRFSAPQPTLEEIVEIGNLPYVRTYDSFMRPSFFSRELRWVGNGGILEWSDGIVEQFEGRGVENPELTDIQAGLIKLYSGRTFTANEMESGARVAIISNEFANLNDLIIGSVIELENNVYNFAEFYRRGIGNFSSYWHDVDFMVAHKVLGFEVIGIFEVTNHLDFESLAVISGMDFQMAQQQENELKNRIYMPISTAEAMINFYNEGMRKQWEEFSELLPADAETINLDEPRIHSIFLLNDPRYLERFAEIGTQILPEHWEISDFRGVDASVISSLDTMRSIADIILILAIGAMVITLALTITLLLKERRTEIGLYMALGERKKNIISQLLLETLTVAVFGIGLSLFAGNGLSTLLSGQLLEQHLMENNTQTSLSPMGGIPWEIALFNPGELDKEELLEYFDTSLTGEIMLIFIAVGTGTVLLSLTVPITYLLKLEPKKVLL
ncbi:MAG: ABC transporter permease [Turicibacter sp.]|nr:ABC transporter permease [Turicibacter sp.]